jgi:hypothetical protein
VRGNGISARDRYGGADVVRSKYGVAKKADRTMDGIVFDSRAEMKRYQELKWMEKAGEIRDIELQPEYVLVYPFVYKGKKFRGVKYRADFRYRTVPKATGPHIFGELVVEDVKGVSTPLYRAKLQMLLTRYPDINFTEVK